MPPVTPSPQGPPPRKSNPEIVPALTILAWIIVSGFLIWVNTTINSLHDSNSSDAAMAPFAFLTGLIFIFIVPALIVIPFISLVSYRDVQTARSKVLLLIHIALVLAFFVAYAITDPNNEGKGALQSIVQLFTGLLGF